MNLIDRVYKNLRKSILHGEIVPGTRLTETQLAERFQISRTPVREALSRLKNEGLVCDSPGSGVIVSDCSVADVEELMGIRVALETYALEQAFDKLTEMDIMQLEFFIKKAEHFAEEKDVNAVFEINTQFHDYIMEKSGNKRLKRLLSNMMDAILRYRIATLHYPGNMETSIRNHSKLIEALKSQDKKSAKRLLIEDIESAKKILLKVLEEDNSAFE